MLLTSELFGSAWVSIFHVIDW